MVQAGGLMSYGPDYSELYRRAAGHVYQIPQGVKPGDVPIEQPAKFEEVINSKTAKALGINTPGILLMSATEAIE